MKWLAECGTLDEVKALHKKLAKQYHPDLGGDTETMQTINREYAFASAKAIKGNNLSDEETKNEIRFSEEYREAIERIIHLEGVNKNSIKFNNNPYAKYLHKLQFGPCCGHFN